MPVDEIAPPPGAGSVVLATCNGGGDLGIINPLLLFGRTAYLRGKKVQKHQHVVKKLSFFSAAHSFSNPLLMRPESKAGKGSAL